MPIFQLRAHQIHEKFLKGEIKAVEIIKHFLKRIEQHNETLGSFLTILEEKALKQAKALDEKREQKKQLGSLAGIPIAIKDNMHIQGEITSCASRFLKNYKAPFSAAAVDLLEKEDAIFIGKTNLDEFAMGSSNEYSAFFPAHNPWNLECTPGGSSGGSAAAVAARLAPIATGTDTGGSIRQPAAFCGIVGLKPTYGRVSRYGLVAFGSSLDQIGPFTTNVKDCGLIMEVIGKHCLKDATSLNLPKESYIEDLPTHLKDIKIGVPWHFLENLNESGRKNFDQSIEVLKSLGAKIIDVDLDVLKHSIAVYYILATAEASTNLARFDGIRYGVRAQNAKTLSDVYDISRDEGFGPEVKKRIMLGTYVLSAGYKDAYYRKAQKIRSMIKRAYEKAFDAVDAIVMPVSPITAFKLKEFQDPIEMYLQDIFTISANLAGIPALSIPSGFDENKKPFGLQILGPQMHDTALIKYAYAYEQQTKYTEKIPPLFQKDLS